MPLIDKPLSELLTYQGINPRPSDFDAYWNEALRELDQIDPRVELMPSQTITSRHAECFDLWFTGIGDARVHAKYLRPRNRQGKQPALLQFHGYTGNSGDWVEKLPYVAEGFCMAMLDCRGQGGLSEDNLQIKGNTHYGHIIRGLDDPDPSRLLFRHIFLDTALLARIVMGFAEVDPQRVGAFGGSQGGALTLACAALEPRIRLAAPVYPFLCDYQRVWEMDLCKDAYAELRTFFRLFDPTHSREEEIFTRLGYIDVQFLAPRIRAKTLMAVGLMDTICPPSSQFAAYNKITAPKELAVYPDFGHEGLPGHTDRTFQFLMGL
jgi:cephalosporin-C deacetylase